SPSRRNRDVSRTTASGGRQPDDNSDGQRIRSARTTHARAWQRTDARDADEQGLGISPAGRFEDAGYTCPAAARKIGGRSTPSGDGSKSRLSDASASRSAGATERRLKRRRLKSDGAPAALSPPRLESAPDGFGFFSAFVLPVCGTTHDVRRRGGSVGRRLPILRAGSDSTSITQDFGNRYEARCWPSFRAAPPCP